MSKSRVFIGISISFAIGIFVASVFAPDHRVVLMALGVSAVVLIFALLFSVQRIVFLALLLFSAALGCFRLEQSIVQNEYTEMFGQKQKLEGYIVEDPDIRTDKQLVTFKPKGKTQNILLTTTLGQQFFYGDWVVLEGKVTEAKNFDDFDYKKYLERFNVYAVSSYPKILILKSHQLNPVKEDLLKIKAAFAKKISQLFVEPQRGLVMGILIGAKKSLPQEIIDNFNTTGTSHIIAVSGFNITIIIGALSAVSRLLGRRVSFWITLIFILGFVVITGGSASVIRASVMGFLLLLAINIGRQYAVTPALFFAALLMLALNPRILFWDVGFQLSFVATAGIIYFYPLLHTLTQKIPEDFGLKTLLLTTLSAIVATLPLILFNFGRLSLSAPLVNILVLPVVPFAMLFGFLSVMPLVGPGFAFVANGLLFYIIEVINYFAKLPYSAVNFSITVGMFWLLTSCVFALYFFLAFLSRPKPKAVEQWRAV